VLAVFLSARGITNEGSGSLQGDMPRYMMNGAMLYDFAAQGGATSMEGVLRYAQHYFARYPALSLGHHPPLLPALLVPAYGVFGVSVFSARLVIVACFLVSAWLLFSIARRLYDGVAGGWAALLFVTSPFVVDFSQAVMSEIPTLMCVLLTMRMLLRFRDSGRPKDYGLFVLAAVASLFAKQVAVFVFPAYLVLLSDSHGRGQMLRRDIMGWTLAGVLLAIPIAYITLSLSPFNVAIVVEAFHQNRGIESLEQGLLSVLRYQVRPALAIVTAAGVAVAMYRRDKKISLGLVWMVSVVASVVLLIGPFEPERYSIAAVPAYCLCAATLATVPSLNGRRLATVLLVAAVVVQIWSAAAITPVGTTGYQAAAAFVAEGQPAPTVLYSGSVDTGYFVFFMRKLDRLHKTVVLRADKLLTTSLMGAVSVQDRIQDPAEIYDRLQRLGTRYVVIEDRPTGSTVLDWLRDELRTDRFVERLRVPIGTRDRRLRDVALLVYEYRDATFADPAATIDIDVPLVGRHVNVPLADLVPALVPRQTPIAPFGF
jgi:hypothetical protein